MSNPKMWRVTYTEDKRTYKTESIEGKTYTEAYLNTMVKHPEAMIVYLGEC